MDNDLPISIKTKTAQNGNQDKLTQIRNWHIYMYFLYPAD